MPAYKCPHCDTWLNKIRIMEQNYEMHDFPKEWIGKTFIFCSGKPQHQSLAEGWL